MTVTADNERERRLVVTETIGCALVALRRTDYVVCDDDVREALTRARVTLLDASATLNKRLTARNDFEQGPAMKINQIEIVTDAGRRVVQFSPPLDVDPTGDMPPQMQSLNKLVWDCLQKAAVHGAHLVQRAPKAEA